MSNIKDLLSIGVDGTGTANSVMKWLDTNTATDSIIYDNGTNIGIGTSSSATRLQIGITSDSENTITLKASATGANKIFFSDGTGAALYAGFLEYTHSDNKLAFGTNSVERMRIDSSGNVGIGTSTTSGARLHIIGGSLGTSNNALGISAGLDAGVLVSGYGVGLSCIHTTYNDDAIEISTGSSPGYVSGIVVSPRSATGTVSDAIALYTRSTERMRVTSSGDLIIANSVNIARLRVDSQTITAGVNNNIFNFSGLTPGAYLVSIVKRDGSSGTKWVGTVAATGSAVYVQTVLDSNGISATQSGSFFQVNPSSTISVSGTVKPLSID